MTDSEKINEIEKRIKRIEINSYIHIGIVVLTFIGIASLSTLINKGRRIIK